jgi:hypothetical protein
MRRSRRWIVCAAVGVAIALAFGAWLLWPRTAVVPARFEEIHVGMTLADVEDIMGGKAPLQQVGNVLTGAPVKAGETTHVWVDPWDGCIAVACVEDRVVGKRFQSAEEMPLMQRLAIWLTQR